MRVSDGSPEWTENLAFSDGCTLDMEDCITDLVPATPNPGLEDGLKSFRKQFLVSAHIQIVSHIRTLMSLRRGNLRLNVSCGGGLTFIGGTLLSPFLPLSLLVRALQGPKLITGFVPVSEIMLAGKISFMDFTVHESSNLGGVCTCKQGFCVFFAG
jgi:hypothetical protein